LVFKKLMNIKLKKFFTFLTIFYFFFNIEGSTKDAPASFADLAERLMPSVVNISTTQTVVTRSNPFPGLEFPPGSPFADMFKDFGTPQTRKASALGSGFIIDTKGIVITNNHVIQGAEDILVRVDNDKEYKAKVIGADPLSDIAVLQIDSKEKFIPVKFGNSNKARIGDWVIAIGNPFGLGGTVTSGIISARNRSIGLSRYEDYIQTDASINTGNSGGPLFDMNGDVIGINTAILGKGGSIGIGFAIPSNSAKKVINQLIEFGETKRGWLGVRIQVVTKEIADIEKLGEPRGALVASVAEKSPSDKAGIKAGDIILEFNGTKIKEMKELPKIVAQTKVGKIVDVKIWRNKKQVTKKIKLGRLETSKDFKEKDKEKKIKPVVSEIKALKISVRLLTKKDLQSRKLPNQTTGLVIMNIAKDSPVNYLNANDIIVEAQKKKIKSAKDLETIIEQAMRSGQKTILIAIYNNQNQRRYIGVKLD
jgi:serine protease Do